MTNSFNSVCEIFEAMNECASDSAFTKQCGFPYPKVEILQCGLQEDLGVYASMADGVNFLIADSDDLFSEHLKGDGEITVCRIETPNGEMFDEPEAIVTQLGTFNDFAEAYAAFTAAVNAELNK
ncbi:hypothetical protein MPK66_gp251 [Erwinia phage pEa_SNUABM_2]|uniref:Uncharacterized protein n=1 Tax=Erwinia phage pEa_SNUABM_2 TaxID=2869547 RepID=A0AAE7XPM3_9CAUD|nr:hypothetical protein MPK66_gp251 [Erwinia phage pEa_SNUABM_2]QZE59495.1 hypothetical protein pEaSNUABM2_00251 [Erwinia phage pEa_SNUABM_2]QZE59831.1 hypothetical protein pEaSNUABM39_00251 [Erwinia phage pEa_SNUABM_39]